VHHRDGLADAVTVTRPVDDGCSCRRSPGAPRLLSFDDVPPDLSAGFHVNLHNNVWGTNFRMCLSEDALFRFRLTVRQGRCRAERLAIRAPVACGPRRGCRYVSRTGPASSAGSR